MDYEKKYNEALERAKKLSVDGYLDAIAVEEIFPQLRESEDEEIRKDIIGGLMWQRDNLESEGPHDNNLILPGFCLNVGKHLSYLEKKKEHSMSAEEVLTRAGLKPYKDGNQWCILAGDNIQEGICGFGDTIEDALYEFLKEVIDLQKEQKPVEDSGTAEPDYGICDDYIPAAIHVAMARHGWYAGHVGEEEEFVLQRKKNAERNWPADKDNLTQEQKEQKPAEWSVKDKLTVDSAIFWLKRRLLLEKAEDISTDSCPLSMRKTAERLKSLRPSWKPSEEQMRALNKVVNGEVLLTTQHESLESLYEQLKKL